ncbi:hypothetical protein M885DRAFT_500912 [Pelagophyceae sp. CCMP2097]|nr:hypothetical protein M885DRAFT_500912 [Pelagophyceae sp. CCMP2097]
MAPGVKELIFRACLDRKPFTGPKSGDKWKLVQEDLRAGFNMESSQQGLVRFVKKFLSDWWKHHESDNEAKESGNHDEQGAFMTELERVYHDCYLLLMDAENQKKKTVDVKTEADAAAAVVEVCGDEVIATALNVCAPKAQRGLQRDSQGRDAFDLFNMGIDGNAGADDTDDDVLDMTSDAPAVQKKKRKSIKLEADEDVPAPIADIMGGYLLKKNATATEELRLKAEKQTHDMLMERERTMALIAVEAGERDSIVAERLAGIAERQAQLQQNALVMQLMADMQKARG